MRLGADPIKLHDGTRVREVYGEAVIYERHRHRYEVNNLLRKRLQNAGLGDLRHLPGRAPRRGRRARPTTRSTSPRSSTRSSSRAPSARRRCSASSSPPRWRGARGRRARGGARLRHPRLGRPVRRRALRPAVSEARRARRTPAARWSSATCTRCSPSCARSTAPRCASGPAASASAAELRGARPRGRARTARARRSAPTAGTCSRGCPAARRQRAASVLLCAHLDTVPALAPIEPVLRGRLLGQRQRGDPRRRQQGRDRGAARARAARSQTRARPVDLELLFTVGEEISLAGAKEFDASRLRSDYGYVFDHASPIGEVIIDSPCHFRIEARFRGAAAHAGIRPQDGRSAILAASRAIASLRHGLIEGEGTVNVGTIEGGTRDQRRARALLVRRRGPRARRLPRRGARGGGRRPRAPGGEPARLRLRRRRRASGARSPATVSPRRRRRCAPPRRRCARAGTSRCRISSGGGSDANALIAAGFPTVNLANGTERNHEPGERVAARGARGDAGRSPARCSTQAAALEPGRGGVGCRADAEAPPGHRAAGRPGPRRRSRRAAPRRSTLRGRGARRRARRSPTSRSSARARPGDEVIVNVEALDLGLGSGGFDVVHVNLTRGLDAPGATRAGRDEAQLHEPAAHRRRRSRRDERAARAARRPVAVLALHGQLAPVAWAFARARPGRAARLRADRGRRAAGQPLADGRRAARGGPARRAH